MFSTMLLTARSSLECTLHSLQFAIIRIFTEQMKQKTEVLFTVF